MVVMCWSCFEWRKMQKLIRWLERNGGMVSRSIEIVKNNSNTSGGGVGDYSIRAIRPIKPLEILIQIPFDCCIRETIPPASHDCLDPDGVAELNLMKSLSMEKSKEDQSSYAP